MNLQKRLLSQLRVYSNNPRDNLDAIDKVKKSIERYGYKVPIVIDGNDVIVAGHTRFAALLLINGETGNYGEIDVILANDLNENQIKQFRIVDNQVADQSKWDFTSLKLELDQIDDFILEDFGLIYGFDTDEHLIDEDQPIKTSNNMVSIQIGADKIEITEQEYHTWASYVIETHGMTVMDFVRERLELNPADRRHSTVSV
jgi:hypothetical protein